MPLSIGQYIAENWWLVIFIIGIGVMTFLPQRKRKKEVEKMMDSMKRGDWVKTIGGISGKVVSATDQYVVLETGPQRVQITVTRGAIASVGDSPVEAEGLSETQVQIATQPEKKKK